MAVKHNIFAISKVKTSSPEAKIMDEYLKRMHNKLVINQLEIKDDLPKDIQKIQEGKLLLKNIKDEHFVFALEEKGRQFTSEAFAKFISNINSPISYIIGGAYGLSDEVRNRANMILSLSELTFPHIFARIILIEQIYRSEMIFNRHPYHK